MSNDNSLINLGDVTKPATVLIEKISNAVEGVAKPRQLRRVAAAERDASVIRVEAARDAAILEAQTEIEVADLHRRAANRWMNEEAQRQSNMEDITRLALRMVTEDARPNDMDDDWIVDLFDKSRLVSDNDMQTLWARILAGEANVPGSYSRRTINILSDFDKSDAELFRSLCGFVWSFSEGPQPLVFNHQDRIYQMKGLRYQNLNHLETIGLIRFDTRSYRFLFDEGDSRVISYYGRSLIFGAPSISPEFNVGQVMLTRSGAELVAVSHGQEVEGFYDYAVAQLPAHFVPLENAGAAEYDANGC